MLVRADLIAVRRSPYYATLVSWLDAAGAQSSDPASAPALHALLDHSDELVVATFEDETFFVAIRGRYAQDEVPNATRTLSDGRSSAMQLDPKVWVLGDPARALHVASAIGRGGLRGRPSFRAIAADGGFDSGNIGFFVETTDRMRQHAERLRGPLLDVPSIVRPLRTAAGNVTLQSGITAVGIAQMTDAASATSVADSVRQRVQMLANNPFTMIMGLSGILSRVQPQAAGDRVSLSLRASHEEVSSLIDRLGGFLREGLASRGAHPMAN